MTDPNSLLSIRKATPPDVPLIRDLALKTWPVAYRDILTPQALDYMLGYFYSTGAILQQMRDGQAFFLALSGDAAIGFGSVSAAAPGVYKLNKLYVLPGHQKSGAGRALLYHAIAIAQENAAHRMILNVNRNNVARHFYERCGFVVVKEEDVDLGNGVVQEDYVMALDLEPGRQG